MKNQDFRSLSDEGLVHKELSLERTMVQHQFRHRLGQLENTSVLKSVRRDIARAQTELSRRENEAGAAKGSLRAQHASSWKPEAAATAQEAGGGFLSGMLDGQPG